MEDYIQVIAQESGERIDALLARQEAIRSRSAAAKLLEAGLVTLRGGAVRKNYRATASASRRRSPSGRRPRISPWTWSMRTPT